MFSPKFRTRRPFRFASMRKFGSTFQEPKSQKLGLPPFIHPDTFFEHLKIHNARLNQPEKKKSDGSFPLLDEMDLHTPEKDFPEMIESPSDEWTKSLDFDMSEVSFDEGLTSCVSSMDISDLIQRVDNLMLSKDDHHSAIWTRTVMDLERVNSRLSLGQIAHILESLSLIRCPRACGFFHICEPLIMSSIANLAASDAVKILAAYARIEVLWGLHSEDVELQFMKKSGVELQFDGYSSDEIFESQSLMNCRYEIPQLRHYYADKEMKAAASKTGVDRLMGRKFLHVLLPTCLEAIKFQSLDVSDCVKLLLAFTAQRPRLLEGSVVKRHKQSSDWSHVISSRTSTESKLDRYGQIISGTAYELIRCIRQDTVLRSAPLTQPLVETLCLAVFLFGRLKSAHDSALQGFRSIQQISPDISAGSGVRSAEQIKSGILVSRLSFIFGGPPSSSNSSSLTPKLQTLLLQLTSNLLQQRNASPLDFTALLLLDSGLTLLELTNVPVADDIKEELQTRLDRLTPNEFIHAISMLRILRYFECRWTLPLLRLAVNRNDDMNRHHRAELEESIHKILWWTGHYDYKELREFCQMLQKNKLIRRKHSHQTSFAFGSVPLDRRFPTIERND